MQPTDKTPNGDGTISNDDESLDSSSYRWEDEDFIYDPDLNPVALQEPAYVSEGFGAVDEPSDMDTQSNPAPLNVLETVAFEDELEAPFVQQLRIPPHSLEAESSVLGGVLLDNASWDKIGDLLTEEDFYRYEHKLIFGAIHSLMNLGRAADTLTVFEHLKSQGKSEEAGNIEYLNSLAQYVPSEGNIRRFAEVVRERAMLRKLLSVSEEITTSAMNTGGRPVPTILDEAEQKIFNVGEESARKRQGFQKLDTLGATLLDRITEMSQNPSDVTGVPTGFYDLDRMTSGLQGGDLVILAARPSMGKTALAINIAEHVALNEGLPVAIFSMEMGAAQLVVRIVGSLGRIDQNRLRTGKLQPDEFTRLVETADRVGRSSLFIDESPGLTPSELRANARRLARKCGKLGLIVVDYLQLMSGSNGSDGENRATELGEISRGLKMLAKELQCPVIALSQLSRGVEQRPDKKPMMSDLRESGAIEQDADVIMFIYRDDYYKKELSKEPGVAEIIIAKQRNGPTGSVKLAFLKNITKFESLATGYNP
jgi:replicative DNA helicase